MTTPDEAAVHLPMIQTVIVRQAGNSFLVKGWALTLATVVDAYALDQQRPVAALLGLLPLLLLAAADAYYLRQERLFRDLYDAVRKGNAAEPYSMDTSVHATGRCAYRRVVLSPSVWPLWCMLAAAGVVAAVAS